MEEADAWLAKLRAAKTRTCRSAKPDLDAEALADVQRLYRFLASKDNNAAQRAVMAIRTGIRILAQRPHIGRPVDDMEPEFREWVIDFGNSANLALYHFDGQAAVLLAVRHQARPLASRKSLL